MHDDFLVRDAEPVDEQPNHVDERDRRTSAVIPRNVLFRAYYRCGYDSRTQSFSAALHTFTTAVPVSGRILFVQGIRVLRVHARVTTAGGHGGWPATDSLSSLLHAVARHVQEIQRLADRDSLADTPGNRILVVNGVTAGWTHRDEPAGRERVGRAAARAGRRPVILFPDRQRQLSSNVSRRHGLRDETRAVVVRK